MRDTDEIRRRDDGAGPEIEHGVVRRVWMLPDGGIDVFLLCELGDIHHRPSRQQMLFVRSEGVVGRQVADKRRSEEHTSELQSLMRISYAVFCLKKKNKK